VVTKFTFEISFECSWL